ncbi:Biotin carboxyl carrier protein of acetyl-CoA carboxylase, chloroplastic [Morella rubra]|uniref:Biotin carboxyl carrier protein of acetyl-CoA carboxylase n=1 Tax=Morella rubra TaxID=262757 RepID=A0A6A1USD7_9ROSI|nr:Biotin carboxyl carrier protein of acetyl-CoA carboxylase, chloroplastic [Morella rubra]KAB1203407.1 Biotin carboxyl carrier protein of acetyl-CoA carboxylase, chloroplastic [Morella rubra]
MASSLTTASASASASAVSKASASFTRLNNNYSLSKISLRFSPKPNLRCLTKGNPIVLLFRVTVLIAVRKSKHETMIEANNSGMTEPDFENGPSILKVLQPSQNCSTVVKAQFNEVGGDGSSDAAATPPTKSEVVAPEAKDVKQSNNPSSGALGTEESISGFIAQVSSLVKLVDSRDIVELQLKQLDCEVLIRKREALPQPTPPTPATFMHSHASTAVPPSQPVPAPASSLAPAVSSSSTSPSAVKSAKSSLPPLKCPMAGTFYRSPAPGEPAFVKVGDKVQKGQVLCIIEAMKLMNEIEADQSGTIVEILAEDGKPVSVDTPLFVIEP